jgi:PAT family beta-lactamase induction signal transducer AmpG
MFASLQDASVDAMAISVTPIADRGRINACMRGGMLIGTSLGAGIMSIVMHSFGFFQAALLQSIFLFAFTFITFFIREKKTDAWLWKPASKKVSLTSIPEQNPGSVFIGLFQAIFSRATLPLFLVIVSVYTCLSIFIRSFNVHLIQKLHWTDTYLSTLSGTYVLVASVCIIFISGLLADRIGAGRMLMVIMLIIGSYLFVFNLLAPVWENVTVASTGLLIYYLFDPSFSVAAMPILMQICRKGIEGSQFTTYMSLVNFCDVAGAYLSGYALLWFAAPTIGLLCGLLIIAALLYLYFWVNKSILTPIADTV